MVLRETIIGAREEQLGIREYLDELTRQENNEVPETVNSTEERPTTPEYEKSPDPEHQSRLDKEHRYKMYYGTLKQKHDQAAQNGDPNERKLARELEKIRKTFLQASKEVQRYEKKNRSPQEINVIERVPTPHANPMPMEERIRRARLCGEMYSIRQWKDEIDNARKQLQEQSLQIYDK